VVHGGEQVDLPALGAFWAPQRLAIDRDRLMALAWVVVVGQPRADHRG
jgi:hypothetical protein